MFLACFQEEMHWTLTKLDNWRDHGLGLVTKSCSPKLREELGAMARAAMVSKQSQSKALEAEAENENFSSKSKKQS